MHDRRRGRLAGHRQFPSLNDARSVTRGEVLALRLAALAGIDATQARIVELGEDENKAPVADIRRFDRDGADGRIPYQSAASLLQASRAEERSYTESVLGEVHAAVANWRQVALDALAGLRPAELDDFAPAFEHPHRDAAAALLRR